MGYDEETKDGHWIYWPERCTISIERSVKFSVNDEIVVGELPLEGEKATATPDDEVERLTTTEAENRDVDKSTSDAPDHEGWF